MQTEAASKVFVLVTQNAAVSECSVVRRAQHLEQGQHSSPRVASHSSSAAVKLTAALVATAAAVSCYSSHCSISWVRRSTIIPWTQHPSGERTTNKHSSIVAAARILLDRRSLSTIRSIWAELSAWVFLFFLSRTNAGRRRQCTTHSTQDSSHACTQKYSTTTEQPWSPHPYIDYTQHKHVSHRQAQQQQSSNHARTATQHTQAQSTAAEQQRSPHTYKHTAHTHSHCAHKHNTAAMPHPKTQTHSPTAVCMSHSNHTSHADRHNSSSSKERRKESGSDALTHGA